MNQSFFEKVAPCTATPEFLGRFRRFLEPGNQESVVRFSYVFDFRFGAQQVDVEIVRTPSPDVVYLCVDRRKIMPPRSQQKLPPGIEQRELAPNEDKSGVLRDDEQRRFVRASSALIEALVLAGERVAPEVWPHVAEEWGFTYGRRAAVELEAEALESFDRLLRDLPIVTVFEVVARALRRDGWGSASVDFAHSKSGLFVVTLQRNAMAEATARRGRGGCAFFTGFFRAILTHLSERRLVVRELRCASKGASACELVVVAESRKDRLDDAMRGESLDASTIAERMRAR